MFKNNAMVLNKQFSKGVVNDSTSTVTFIIIDIEKNIRAIEV
jgi:hypothetical protein